VTSSDEDEDGPLPHPASLAPTASVGNDAAAVCGNGPQSEPVPAPPTRLPPAPIPPQAASPPASIDPPPVDAPPDAVDFSALPAAHPLRVCYDGLDRTFEALSHTVAAPTPGSDADETPKATALALAPLQAVQLDWVRNTVAALRLLDAEMAAGRRGEEGRSRPLGHWWHRTHELAAGVALVSSQYVLDGGQRWRGEDPCPSDFRQAWDELTRQCEACQVCGMGGRWAGLHGGAYGLEDFLRSEFETTETTVHTVRRVRRLQADHVHSMVDRCMAALEASLRGLRDMGTGAAAAAKADLRLRYKVGKQTFRLHSVLERVLIYQRRALWEDRVAGVVCGAACALWEAEGVLASLPGADSGVARLPFTPVARASLAFLLGFRMRDCRQRVASLMARGGFAEDDTARRLVVAEALVWVRALHRPPTDKPDAPWAIADAGGASDWIIGGEWTLGREQAEAALQHLLPISSGADDVGGRVRPERPELARALVAAAAAEEPLLSLPSLVVSSVCDPVWTPPHAAATGGAQGEAVDPGPREASRGCAVSLLLNLLAVIPTAGFGSREPQRKGLALSSTKIKPRGPPLNASDGIGHRVELVYKDPAPLGDSGGAASDGCALPTVRSHDDPLFPSDATRGPRHVLDALIEALGARGSGSRGPGRSMWPPPVVPEARQRYLAAIAAVVVRSFGGNARRAGDPAFSLSGEDHRTAIKTVRVLGRLAAGLGVKAGAPALDAGSCRIAAVALSDCLIALQTAGLGLGDFEAVETDAAFVGPPADPIDHVLVTLARPERACEDLTRATPEWVRMAAVRAVVSVVLGDAMALVHGSDGGLGVEGAVDECLLELTALAWQARPRGEALGEDGDAPPPLRVATQRRATELRRGLANAQPRSVSPNLWRLCAESNNPTLVRAIILAAAAVAGLAPGARTASAAPATTVRPFDVDPAPILAGDFLADFSDNRDAIGIVPAKAAPRATVPKALTLHGDGEMATAVRLLLGAAEPAVLAARLGVGVGCTADDGEIFAMLCLSTATADSAEVHDGVRRVAMDYLDRALDPTTAESAYPPAVCLGGLGRWLTVVADCLWTVSAQTEGRSRAARASHPGFQQAVLRASEMVEAGIALHPEIPSAITMPTARTPTDYGRSFRNACRRLFIAAADAAAKLLPLEGRHGMASDLPLVTGVGAALASLAREGFASPDEAACAATAVLERLAPAMVVRRNWNKPENEVATADVAAFECYKRILGIPSPGFLPLLVECALAGGCPGQGAQPVSPESLQRLTRWIEVAKDPPGAGRDDTLRLLIINLRERIPLVLDSPEARRGGPRRPPLLCESPVGGGNSRDDRTRSGLETVAARMARPSIPPSALEGSPNSFPTGTEFRSAPHGTGSFAPLPSILPNGIRMEGPSPDNGHPTPGRPTGGRHPIGWLVGGHRAPLARFLDPLGPLDLVLPCNAHGLAFPPPSSAGGRGGRGAASATLAHPTLEPAPYVPPPATDGAQDGLDRLQAAGAAFGHAFLPLVAAEMRSTVAEALSAPEWRERLGGQWLEADCCPLKITRVQDNGQSRQMLTALATVEATLRAGDVLLLAPRPRCGPKGAACGRDRVFDVIFDRCHILALVAKIKKSSSGTAGGQGVGGGGVSGLGGHRVIIVSLALSFGDRTTVFGRDDVRLSEVRKALVPETDWLALPVHSIIREWREVLALASMHTLPPSLLMEILLPPSERGPPRCDLPGLDQSARNMSQEVREAVFGCLNRDQRRAVEVVVHNRSLGRGASPLTLVQGPPGTGKSTVVAALVRAFLVLEGVHPSNPGAAEATGPKVLLCAQTNAAVDVLAKRLLELGFVDPTTGRRGPANVVRVGRAEATTLDEVRSIAVGALFDEARKAKKDAVDGEGQQTDEPLVSTAVVDKALRSQIILKSRVVVSTLSTAGGELRNHLPTPVFDLVVVDEAACATEPALLIALSSRLLAPGAQVVLVGDHQQLPPFVMSNAKSVAKHLSRSTFQRLQETSKSAVVLSEQYRMHPDLCAFPSKHFYGGALVCASGVVTAETRHAPGHPLWGVTQDARRSSAQRTSPTELARAPRVFWNVAGAMAKAAGSSSLYNPAEADCAAALVGRLAASDEGLDLSVAVLAMYSAQVDLLRARLDRLPRRPMGSQPVHVATVDAFQGREADIVILSTVRTPEMPSVYKGRAFDTGVGFVGDVRRINVALTRARRSLWIIGNEKVRWTEEDAGRPRGRRQKEPPSRPSTY